MPHEKVANAIVKEIPAPFIKRFLDGFAGSTVANANGSGCGNGCGNGCVDGTGITVDRFNQADISARELESAHKDVAGLRAAVSSAVSSAVK